MRGNFIYSRLGQKVCVERRDQGLTQERLSNISGVDRTFIGRVEQGKANPSFRTLHKLARALGVRLSDLLEGV